MIKDPDTTITTICDRNYFWGAYLLVSSLRMNKINFPIHILGIDLSENEYRILEQFTDTKVFRKKKLNHFEYVSLKPNIMLTATDTKYITWMDADCIIQGNISNYLIPEEKSLMIRFRNTNENNLRFKGYYESGDTAGSIPQKILNQWKNDVNCLSTPRIQSTCSTNCFTIHQDHRNFIQQWKDQINLILENSHSKITKNNSIYVFSSGSGLSDELILNSLLAFSDKAPKTVEYMLDKDPKSLLIHFVLSPKPWKKWIPKSFRHSNLVYQTMEWSQKKYLLSDIPAPLNRKRRYIHFFLSYFNLFQLYWNKFYERIATWKISSLRPPK